MTTSLLATKMSSEAVANGGVPWSVSEAAVELLLNGLGAGAQVATPSITDVTSSGSVSAGAKALWFELSSDFSGTILGKAYTGAATSLVNIPVPSGHTLAAVAYTVSAGTLSIFKAI